jgi:hypothetical protein
MIVIVVVWVMTANWNGSTVVLQDIATAKSCDSQAAVYRDRGYNQVICSPMKKVFVVPKVEK